MSDSANKVTCRHVLLEATEKGKDLSLTFEQEHFCKIVYKKEEDGEGYRFWALWNPEADIEEPGDYIVVPLRSTYIDTVDYDAGVACTNVCGSSGDYPYEGGKWAGMSWISFLNTISGANPPYTSWRQCVMEDCFYTKDEYGNEFVPEEYAGGICGGIIVGGHVVPGTTIEKPSKGDVVYILPICSRHNTVGPKGTGTVFYMKTMVYGIGIAVNYRINT